MKKGNVHGLQVNMHEKEYYDLFVYYKLKKYAAKDDDKRHDRGDPGDGAKYHGWWWSW
jgi:hypothetical protein